MLTPLKYVRCILGTDHFLTTSGRVKLSELLLSVKVLTLCPFLTEYWTGFCKEDGESNSNSGKKGKMHRATVCWFCEFWGFNWQTLARYPFLPQVLLLTSLAEHLIRACRDLSQKQHFWVLTLTLFFLLMIVSFTRFTRLWLVGLRVFLNHFKCASFIEY